MATIKYLSLDGLTEYDALIKQGIAKGDESTLSSANSYTDEKISSIPIVDSYTKTEIDAALANKSDTTHNHDTVYENTSNKVTSISSSSTDTQYPSAKAIYSLIGNVSSAISTINSII